MKTKFILHGGYSKGAKQENDAFFSEILKSAPKEARILLVYFAESDDRVVERYVEDLEQFNKNRGDKTLSFDRASEQLFVEQANTADIIYLHGGHTGKLLEALKRISDLRDLFNGKIIAGDSAGANVLCSVFYSKTIGTSEGLGFIPIKIICHYLEEDKNKLAHVRIDLETVFLPEYETKTFSINI